MKAGDIIASKYRLVTRIGQGGMGSVWRASNTFTGRDFAIKFLLPQAATHEDSRHRFTQEARASARINHPNAIDVYDVGEGDDGGLYLVMELLDGLSLAEALRAQPPFTARELLIVLAEASTALNAAHNSGVIHRDLKPGNIFLHRDRASGFVTAKVLDFGVSKLVGNDDGVATSTGSLLGSPRYMAPEQAISASQADARSDIWSLGVVIFEALTGRFPHDGESSNNLIIAIATTPPKSISEVAPQLPASLRQLVDDCLRPAAQRIPTIRVFLDRVLTILATEDLSQISLARPSVARGKVLGRPDGLMFRTSAGAIPGLATSMLSQQGLEGLAPRLAPSAPASSPPYFGSSAPQGSMAPSPPSPLATPAVPQQPQSYGPHPSYAQLAQTGGHAAYAPAITQQPLTSAPLTRQTVRIPPMQATPAFHAAAAAASDPTIESVSSINVVRPDRGASSPPPHAAPQPPRKYLLALVAVLSVGAVVSIALLVSSAGGDKRTASATGSAGVAPSSAANDATPPSSPARVEPRPAAASAAPSSGAAASATASALAAEPSSSPSAATSASQVAVGTSAPYPSSKAPATPTPPPRPRPPSTTKVTGMDTGLE